MEANEFTYTERLFSSSIEEIREMWKAGKTVEEIASSTNLSDYLVKALIERFVV